MSGIEDMMTYAPGSSPRVKDVRAYKLLTSKGVVGVFVAGFLIATGAVFIAIPEPLHSLLVLPKFWMDVAWACFVFFDYSDYFYPVCQILARKRIVVLGMTALHCRNNFYKSGWHFHFLVYPVRNLVFFSRVLVFLTGFTSSFCLK